MRELEHVVLGVDSAARALLLRPVLLPWELAESEVENTEAPNLS